MKVETLIIGAGVAGAAMAHVIRGQDVLVVEAGEIAGGASGNPKGFIKPYLSFGNSKMRAFYHAAYQGCQKLFGELPGDYILQKGILQLPKDGEDRFPQGPALAGLGEEDLEYLTSAEASGRLGMECRTDAIYWRRGVVVDPARWVKALLGDVPVKTQKRITKLTRENSVWRVETDGGEIITANRVIITTGNVTGLLPENIAALIRPRAGQISYVPRAALPILPSGLSFGEYWIPPAHTDEPHLIGATFDATDRAEVTHQGHMHNITAIQKLSDILPEIKSAAQQLTPDICTGRAAVRATTRDHLPLFGGANENLFYLTGLGSRGLMSAPYAALQLSQIMDLSGKIN